VHDELTGANFEWNDRPWVRLDPWSEVAHILSVRYPEGQER
jgi:starch synthase (maltosyl-transferring)